MEFKPQSEEEIAEAGLIKKGDYSFEILEAQDKTSKSGNQMIVVKLGVFTEEGKMRKVTDYLLPTMAYKLRHFCDAVGLLPQYQDGSLCADDCKGRTGMVRVDVEPSQNGFPPKNIAKDYITRPAKPLGSDRIERSEPVSDDNLPF